MVNLALFIRFKELRYMVKKCKEIISAKGKFRRFMTAAGVVLKHLLMWPLMVPIKLFAGLVLSIAYQVGVKVEERKLYEKFYILFEEYEELIKEMKKG